MQDHTAAKAEKSPKVLPEPIADPVSGACARMGIGLTKLYEEIKTGRLRAVKVGRKTLIPRVEQQSWLASLPAIEVRKAA